MSKSLLLITHKMTTSNILMIRPAAFAYNQQTAVNNTFQKENNATDAQEKALKEFDAFVEKLRLNGIKVTIVQDSVQPHTPDAIFPNNWVSFHEDGTIVTYPMFAANRRLERQKAVIPAIAEKFFVRGTIDLTDYENSNAFLEGTGSMVLDRDNELAYACLSPRTNATPFYGFCDAMGYNPVIFQAVDNNGIEIYHTNVMMCVADEYVVICLDAVKDELQKQMLIARFKETNKVIVTINMEQMNHFAGNMLQLENATGEPVLIMSSQAYHALTEEQINLLESFNSIIHSPLNTIEENGGGSARCMIAEIFLPQKHY